MKSGSLHLSEQPNPCAVCEVGHGLHVAVCFQVLANMRDKYHGVAACDRLQVLRKSVFVAEDPVFREYSQSSKAWPDPETFDLDPRLV